MIEIEVDNRAELHEIRDQGPLKTCLAHATSTAHGQARNLDEPLSAEALHFHANGGDFDSGCTIHQIRQTLRTTGQPITNDCDPILFDEIEDWEPPSDSRYYQSLSNTVPSMVEVVSESIQEGDFPILGITMTREFLSPNPPRVISQGDEEGKHAVVGVGVGKVESEPSVLIRNSWGSDWGDSGHAWLDSSFLDNHLLAALVVSGRDSE